MKNNRNILRIILYLSFITIPILFFSCKKQSSSKMPLANTRNTEVKEISAFCGSASKPALEESARLFEKQYGVHVILHFSGSGTMLSQMKMSQKGDLYIPGTPDYMLKAKKEKLIIGGTEQIIAYLVPSILVQKGNPKGISSLKDLAKPGLRIAIGNPESVCVGLYAVEILSGANLINDIRKNIVTLGGSCSKTASLIPMKAVDAIIGWRVFSKWNPETTEAILIDPANIPRIAYIPVAISVFSKNISAAGDFIEFLISKECKRVFKKWGYISSEQEARKFAPKARIGGEYKLEK